MTKPRLLVFTPTYGDLLRPETVASVEAQQFDGILDHEISARNEYPGRDLRNLEAQYQWARDTALSGDYDGLLTVEHDMRIPAHAAQALWGTQATVVYGVYMLRHGMSVLNAWRYENSRNLGMSLALYPSELQKAKEQVIVRVSGIGFGCTLIKRETLAAIPFRYVQGANTDMPFAVDCLQKGIESLARFDVTCDHYHEGRWLTVSEDGKAIARVLANVDVTANADGASVVLRKGKYYSMSIDDALELQRAGYVSISNDAGRETATAEKRETATAPAAKRRTRRK